MDGSDGVWCCRFSLLAPFRTITHPFLPKINFNFHCMYTANALLSIDPVGSTPWLTCCRPVNPDRRIGHPWCNTSTVLLCWFLFYCISILSTWWPSRMIAFNFSPPPCSFCDGAQCLLLAMLWTEGKYLRWSPPPGDPAALHWNLTLPVHSVFLLNSFTMSDIQNGLNCIFRKQLPTCRDTRSFKEPIVTVVNMEWAVPRWRPCPFWVISSELTKQNPQWNCLTLFLQFYWIKIMLHLEPFCWLHNHTQTTAPHCMMPPWPTRSWCHLECLILLISGTTLPDTMRRLLSSF